MSAQLDRRALRKIERQSTSERIRAFVNRLVEADIPAIEHCVVEQSVGGSQTIDLDGTQAKEKRLRQRRERRAERAKVRKGEFVVQDRTKSKAARIREERKRENERGDPSSDSSYCVGRKKRTRTQEQYRSGQAFLDLLSHYRRPSNERNRVTIRQVNNGIFSNGVSSSYRAKARKKHARLRETTSEPCESSSQESWKSEKTKKQSGSMNDRLDALERSLKEMKQAIVNRTDNRQTSSQDIRKDVRQADFPSRNQRSANNLRVDISHMPWATSAKQTDDERAAVGDTSPPPTLAFDNDQPDRHPNGWRAQHRAEHVDVHEIQQRFLDAGGARFRVSTPPAVCVPCVSVEDSQTVIEDKYEEALPHATNYHANEQTTNGVAEGFSMPTSAEENGEADVWQDYGSANAVHVRFDDDVDVGLAYEHDLRSPYTHVDGFATEAQEVYAEPSQDKLHSLGLTAEDLRGFWQPVL